MITMYTDFKQGSPEWLQARLGMLTASEVGSILTPAKLQYSASAKSLISQLASEIISDRPHPYYTNYDMERGHLDEIQARDMYAEHYAPVQEVAFIVRDFGGFKLGYSPDGLVGEDGLIECKSRQPKYQVETIIADAMPREYWLQVQTGLLVSGRKWCDFVSYSEGMHLYVKRIEPCSVAHKAILEAASEFYADLKAAVALYRSTVEEGGFKYIKPVVVLED